MFKAVSPSSFPVGTEVTGAPGVPPSEPGVSSTSPQSQQPPQTPTQKTDLTNNSCKEKKLEDIKNQCSELISELDSDEDPEAIVKKHISKLKEYNELKDIALGLVTMIADQRQLRTTDILEEMKVELSDE